MFSDKGHYLYLPIAWYTDSCAEIRTDFVIPTAKCLSLRYVQLFAESGGTIEIYLRNEDLEIDLVSKIVFPLETDFFLNWWRLIVIKLPESQRLHQVIIKAVRDPEVPSTGMQIDDITIRPCLDFRKYTI